MEVYVARQPIFDVNNEVIAYELLFRTGLQNVFPDVDGDVATTNVMLDNFILNNVTDITEGKKAFINFPENLLLDDFAFYLPKAHVVIEILEDIPAHDEAVLACKKLREAGYTVALDDFVLEPENANAPLINHCDIIKVDYKLTTPDDRTKILAQLEGKNIALLAEKVETLEEYKLAIEEGFIYFQGYFFAKPEIVQGNRIPENKLSNLELIKSVNISEPDIDVISNIIKRDISLTYKLLKCINSASFGLPRKIESIQQALVLLGMAQLRKWVTFIALAELSDDKSIELLRTSLIRARFCEQISQLTDITESLDDLYLMGLLSLADAMMDKPLEVILNVVPMSTEVRMALSGQEDELGYGLILEFVKAFEVGDWVIVDRFCQEHSIDTERLLRIYGDVLNWANDIIKVSRL